MTMTLTGRAGGRPQVDDVTGGHHDGFAATVDTQPALLIHVARNPDDLPVTGQVCADKHAESRTHRAILVRQARIGALRIPPYADAFTEHGEQIRHELLTAGRSWAEFGQ